MSLWARFQCWVYLLGAIVFEVGGTTIMKLSQSGDWLVGEGAGVVLMLVMIALSYYMLALAVQGLPVGVAFAFWEGLGLTLITLVSVFTLGEAMNLTRFFALVCVLSGAMLIHHGTSSGTGPEVRSKTKSKVRSKAAQSVGAELGQPAGQSSVQTVQAAVQGRAS